MQLFNSLSYLPLSDILSQGRHFSLVKYGIDAYTVLDVAPFRLRIFKNRKMSEQPKAISLIVPMIQVRTLEKFIATKYSRFGIPIEFELHKECFSEKVDWQMFNKELIRCIKLLMEN